MKDNFSGHSDQYARFRPSYPQELFDFILKHTNQRNQAWDCGTGNGQVAKKLSQYFDRVKASDISDNQLMLATQSENVKYSRQTAEHTVFDSENFDLITVGQAVHWFDFDHFNKEVRRVLKQKGTLALFGYGLNSVNPDLDKIINHFYHDIIGKYWDEERKHIDNNYASIPFPYHEIECPIFYQEIEWTIDQYLGYLNTWSAVKHYEKAHSKSPLVNTEAELRKLWGNKIRNVKFPIFMRLGILKEG